MKETEEGDGGSAEERESAGEGGRRWRKCRRGRKRDKGLFVNGRGDRRLRSAKQVTNT